MIRNRPFEFSPFRVLENWIAIATILAVFCTKYLGIMLQQNAIWRSGAWYEFFTRPSPAAEAGLLDPVALASYYKTLSVSLGHQLLASANRWLGFEGGTTLLYVATATLLTTAIYLISLHLTHSKVKAFFIALLIINADMLVRAHIGGCGHVAQGSTRDYPAIGFFLLGLYFLLKSRLYLYWFCLYVGFLLHLSHGLFAFAILFPLTILTAKSRNFIVFHVASFGFTALGLYLYQSTGAPPVDPDFKELWFKWVYIFNGGHIFFDHSTDYLLPNFAFFSMLLVGLAIAAARSDERRIVLTVVPAWCLIAIATTVFIYVVPLMLVHQLTPYRSSLLVSAILLIFLLKLFLDQLSPGAPLWRSILALVGLISGISGTFIGIGLAAFAGCLILLAEHQGRTRAIAVAGAFGCMSLLLLTLREYAIYDAFYVLRDGKLWALVLVASIAFAVVRKHRFPLFPGRAVPALLPLVPLIVLIAMTPSRYVSAPVQASIDKLNDYLAASRIIKESSTERETVLTAPLIDMPMLEVTAGRGSVLQLVKAHVPYLAPSLLPRFDRALRSSGIDIAGFKGNWVDLVREAPVAWKKTATSEHLRLLGDEYKAGLVLTYQDHDLNLPALYRGSYFTVYRLAN